MQITGGKVTFLRSVQPAQYETKKAEVEIQFTLAEGEELGNQLDIAAKFAQDKALEMVGLAPAAKVPAGGGGRQASVPATKMQEAPKEPVDPKAQAAANINEREQKATAQKAAAKKPPAATPPTPPADQMPPSDELWDDAPADEAKTYTDKDLTDALNKKNAVLKDPPRLRRVIEEYAGPLPKQVRDIPQEKRGAFIAAIEALT